MRKYCCFNRWLAEWLCEIFLCLIAIWEIVSLRLLEVSDPFTERVYGFVSKQRLRCGKAHYPRPKLQLIINNKTKTPIA